jgi:hypothetical protein
MRLFTHDDLIKILGSNKTAIDELVIMGKIPYKQIDDAIRSHPDAISQWLLNKPELKMDDQKYIERFRKRHLEKAPGAMAAIKEFSNQFSNPQEPKKFYLSKVKNTAFFTMSDTLKTGDYSPLAGVLILTTGRRRKGSL